MVFTTVLRFSGAVIYFHLVEKLPVCRNWSERSDSPQRTHTVQRAEENFQMLTFLCFTLRRVLLESRSLRQRHSKTKSPKIWKYFKILSTVLLDFSWMECWCKAAAIEVLIQAAKLKKISTEKIRPHTLTPFILMMILWYLPAEEGE